MDKKVKSVLCLGDSNTYGVNPENNERFDRNTRWTGRLQSLLGDEYLVIEEGYCGRTTCFSDASDPFRSAISVLDMILKTHMPLDLVIVMLGTNDFKSQFSMTARASGYGIRKIVDGIRKYCRAEDRVCPEILVVSPIMMGEKIGESRFWEYEDKARLEFRKIPSVYSEAARASGAEFLDASSVACPGPDQLHMTRQSHALLAEKLAEKVRNMLS